MDGYQFEEQCAIILKRKHFSKIEVTKSSGDQALTSLPINTEKNMGYSVSITRIPLVTKQSRKLMPVQIFMTVTRSS